MAVDIRDVLNRRNDLSTFVAHLTRDREGRDARENLARIISQRQLIASTPMGWAAAGPSPHSQRVVSFSETPLEHIYSLVADIAGRQIRLRPYGLAFTKLRARDIGANPVWYVDRTAGARHQWALAQAIDAALAQLDTPAKFDASPLARVFPFLEPMGTWPDRQREFWWEREWRHLGDLQFRLRDVALWLCPEEQIEDFEAQILGEQHAAGEQPLVHPQLIDPRWGLEQIIATLIGHGADVTPFGPR